ncbi:hypothetical protein A2870_03430 [Candidatus Curtissbacteria bacterium RIFCSPHIGHO2_01_FULL_41_11]|uniref:Lipoprotein signal peptidase n=1 Tax=Candidatus Curtissbacteria bacterium RIFCSPHIGHO2_01_FULL_41_11 TaxID=1797711 RepID=A0A1F5G5T1_9BACT|nr:MAG: hypothetical protein A2870_03430 [Candidatus Curtissbacteria bacterium RIFCSPHIGHO2_01_FULL_41_11]
MWSKTSKLILIIPIVIFADQISKILVSKTGFDAVCNKGFAFGIAPGFLNGIISVLVLLLVVYLIRKEKREGFLLGYLMIVGGGLSNLIDRITLSCVLDFVNLKIFPLFNMADAAIFLGVVIIVFQLLKDLKTNG